MSEPYPDTDCKIQKKICHNDNNVREADGLWHGVEVDGGVRHPQCSQWEKNTQIYCV